MLRRPRRIRRSMCLTSTLRHAITADGPRFPDRGPSRTILAVTSAPALASGSVFAGDFRIVRPLAEGGMGAVYVAEQLSTGRQRALKVMQPSLAP